MNFKFKDSNIGCVAATILILLIIALVIGLTAFKAWILMLLWNAVLVSLFPSLPTLSFWFAWGLMIICNILFKRVAVASKSN